MQPQKTAKPILSSASSQKVQDSFQQKIAKIQIFYRYRLPSIYRQLKMPIYDNLIKPIAKPMPRIIRDNRGSKETSDPNYNIELLYKKMMLNSKYHHRQKVRFSRTALLKYLKFNFRQLEEKLKSKNYVVKMYEDLQDEDQDDDEKEEEKKDFERDPLFSAQALAKYKKKNDINGYIVSSHGYDDIKNRLIQHYGWTENQDTQSLMYDYKHMSKKKNIDYVNILQNQVVNHFDENKSVTAKFGLTRNIRNICSIGKDPSEFFPRCFDVNDISELENFYQCFKQTYAQSLVIKCVQSKGRISEKTQPKQYQKIVQKCLQIICRNIMPLQQKLTKIQSKKQLYISQQQWAFIQKFETLQSFTAQGSQSISSGLLEKAESVHKQCIKSDPQYLLNKDNIWIVKPASLSRGRGIKTFNNIHEIFQYVIGKEISWVVQKYIENPLIIKKRKFDIRQWVLLTDFKPFRVWIYNECYIRFCATLYTPQNLKDRKIHLTNNSVTKGISEISNDGISENMLSQKQLGNLLQQKQGKDIFKQSIRPQMKRIAIETLESVKQNMVPRKSTFQIFGFDFMIDENYKVWLIQVNSSPTMEYSTKVTTQIVQKGMSDLADVVHNYMFNGKKYNKAKAAQLYGGWELLTNQ